MLPDYEELLALEPRLVELEEEAKAIFDDGKMSFFCSNYEWLPINAKLKALLGTGRKEPAANSESPLLDEDFEEGIEGGEEEDEGPGLLCDSRVYEIAYLRLSVLLPPCRNCGCKRFMPLLLRQVESSRELYRCT